MDSNTIIIFVALIVAVILHEIAHGLVALWLGDDTAKQAGRLTLNPVPHIDPLGSLILPAFGALLHAPVIGWARPVPVNPSRLHSPRRDILSVSLAGPATNFLLAIAAAVAARAAYGRLDFFAATSGDLPLAVRIPYLFALVNLFLGAFNLLPIPPLDGSAIVERMLPTQALRGWYQFRQYGILVLFILVFTTDFAGRVFSPVREQLFEFVFG